MAFTCMDFYKQFDIILIIFLYILSILLDGLRLYFKLKQNSE